MKPEKKPSQSKSRSSSKEKTITSREVLGEAVKAASHPARTQILKWLKKSPSSANELEEATGRSRYDLYHHLAVLQNNHLVKHRFRDGKTKEFFLDQPSRPDSIVMLFDHNDLKENPKALNKLIEAAADLEGTEIPHKKKISGVQIIFSLT